MVALGQFVWWLLAIAVQTCTVSALLGSFRSHCVNLGRQSPSLSVCNKGEHRWRTPYPTGTALKGAESRREGEAKGDNDSDGMLLRLQNRLREERQKIRQLDRGRPPNAKLEGREFVLQVLEALRYPDDPLPDAGYRILLRASSPRWRQALLNSIGAANRTSSTTTPPLSEDVVAAALGSAISRPNNQFAILVGQNAPEEMGDHVVVFPSDPWEDEESCWIECRLYSASNPRKSALSSSSLLVVMGWELVRREGDGAWLIDRIDWQDFRDKFRPGIGREEWMRICG